MNWLEAMEQTIDYIEKHLMDSLDLAELSANVYSSQFHFQKMFSLICEIPITEYIRNRRLTCAGYEIIDTRKSVLDIALKYGYETNESFTRAFTRFHGMTPSQARSAHANLNAFPKLSLPKKLSGGILIMNDLSERGYVVKETGAVYYTKDMDQTLNWFQNILGWYGQIDARNEEGTGTYGCVNHLPMEIEVLHVAPFTGIHLFYGEPLKLVTGFMQVQGIDALYAYVKSHGWNQVTEVKQEPWGSKTCSVTTIDGSILVFFE